MTVASSKVLDKRAALLDALGETLASGVVGTLFWLVALFTTTALGYSYGHALGGSQALAQSFEVQCPRDVPGFGAQFGATLEVSR